MGRGDIGGEAEREGPAVTGAAIWVTEPEKSRPDLLHAKGQPHGKCIDCEGHPASCVSP